MRRLADILYNFHWIVPGEAARSAQAYAGFLASFLRRRGIRAVINLRGTKPGWRWWDYETATCKRLGIAHRDIRFNSRRLPSRALLLEMLDAFDGVPRPFLVKCSGGQDRTSFAAALYLLHSRGWNAHAAAEAQFARWPYLHRPKQHQRWLSAFLRFLSSQDGGDDLRGWIARAYDPQEFKRWLEIQGLGDTFRGTIQPPSRPVNAP